MSFDALRPKVKTMVRDSGGVLLDPDLDQALLDATRRYARTRPRRVVADIGGTGEHDLALPAGWADDYSRIESIEFPIGEREPSLIDELDYAIYHEPAGPVLRLLADTPPVGQNVRVRFTAPHTIAAATTTVPAEHHDVLVLIASAIACEQLASHYSNIGDSTIIADSANHSSKASEYAMRAKRFMALANELLPIKEQGETRAASSETSLGGDEWLLTHRTR